MIRPESGKSESGDGMSGETIVEFKARVRLFVQLHLKNAPGATRDDYKDGPVYQARKDAIQAFLKATVACKKCNRCDW